MLGNYFKIAFRNLRRFKAYSATNIVGLAVGMTATLFILIYIRFELSFDSFHQNAGSLYRISVVDKKEGKVEDDSYVFTPPIGPAMQRTFPEVENFVRLRTPHIAYLSFGTQAFKVRGIRNADSTFFDLFSFRIISGNARTALRQPYSIVLTESLARKIFGDKYPLGKSLKLNNEDLYQVTGVVQNPPANSHIQFNALISFSTLYKDPNMFMGWNGGNQYITYIKLRQNASAKQVEEKLPAFMWQHINKDLASFGSRLEPYLQPLTKIHLFYNAYSDSLRRNLVIFALIAGLILFIACINFINLATARATRRAREVGVRKVVGASRLHLIKQFLGESLLMTVLAFMLSMLLVELLFPTYQSLLGQQIPTPHEFEPSFLAGMAILILLVSALAGTYPAFYLASLQAVNAIKGEAPAGLRVAKFRNVLVVLQFAISITLIACTLLVSRQLHFMRNKELGFNKENVLVMPLIGEEAQLSAGILKTDLARIPEVQVVTACSEIPYNGFTRNGYIPEGHQQPIMFHVVDVDQDFLAAFELKVVKGRNFSQNFPTDKNGYLINETLARLLGWTEPLGKTIVRNGPHKVIGVVKDFHFASLHEPIEPLILTNRPWRDRFDYLAIRLAATNLPQTISAIQAKWQDVAPNIPFEYWFLDSAFDKLYKAEESFQRIFFGFSILAIMVALLGLLSLAAFAAERRTKEIGVRKVLGASVANITALLAKDFIKLVLLANVIAWPVAWYAMHKWLQNFAYRISIEWWVFVLAGGLALVIALLTVSTQAVRAARANPVESLRYE